MLWLLTLVSGHFQFIAYMADFRRAEVKALAVGVCVMGAIFGAIWLACMTVMCTLGALVALVFPSWVFLGGSWGEDWIDLGMDLSRAGFMVLIALFGLLICAVVGSSITDASEPSKAVKDGDNQR